MRFTVRGIPQAMADEARRTRRSPGHGHPVHEELATGTGPCRCCLRPFEIGKERRLLLTYRPAAEAEVLTAPGPVFIHAAPCEAFTGEGFPEALRVLPLAFEARDDQGGVPRLSRGAPAEEHIAELLAQPSTSWLHLRHAEAGCWIARIQRAP